MLGGGARRATSSPAPSGADLGPGGSISLASEGAPVGDRPLRPGPSGHAGSGTDSSFQGAGVPPVELSPAPAQPGGVIQERSPAVGDRPLGLGLDYDPHGLGLAGCEAAADAGGRRPGAGARRVMAERSVALSGRDGMPVDLRSIAQLVQGRGRGDAAAAAAAPPGGGLS